VYPYVEIDGKAYDKLDKHFSFEEKPVTPQAGSASLGHD
jgi:hypothetical protein